MLKLGEDYGPFCGARFDLFCPMSFKARLPALFYHSHMMIPKAISQGIKRETIPLHCIIGNCMMPFSCANLWLPNNIRPHRQEVLGTSLVSLSEYRCLSSQQSNR